MVFLRRCLLLACAFLLSGGPLFAASGRENRDYAAAAAAFQDGMYGRAETAFAQFVEKYPKSGRIGEAVLLQAQADLKLGKFADAIALLTDADNQAKAGKLADEYVYWTGKAQFQDAHYSGGGGNLDRAGAKISRVEAAAEGGGRGGFGVHRTGRVAAGGRVAGGHERRFFAGRAIGSGRRIGGPREIASGPGKIRIEQ